MCHTIYGKYNLLIHMDYSYFGEEGIDRICIGRPIKKGTKKTIRQFSNQLKECQKASRIEVLELVLA